MSSVTGIIQEIKTESRGGRTAYDIVVGGQRYGAGLYAPKAKVGDYVKFDIDDSRGYQNVARGTLKVSKNKAPAEAVAEAAATAPKVSTAGGTVDMKQEVISRQSAKNTAIEFLKLLQSVDALALPAANSKKGSKQEVVEALLAKYEAQFYESNTGVAYKDITPGAKSESVDGEIDEDAEEETAAPEDDAWE